MNLCPCKILSLGRPCFRNKWHTYLWRRLLFVQPQGLTPSNHVDTVLHTFNKPSRNTYYVPSIVIGPWNINTKEVEVPYLRMLISIGRDRYFWLRIEIYWDKLPKQNCESSSGDSLLWYKSIGPDAGRGHGWGGRWRNGKSLPRQRRGNFSW